MTTYAVLKQSAERLSGGGKTLYLRFIFIHMTELLSSFNKKVKEASTAYFSNLIDCNKNNPRALFNAINRLVNPAPPPVFSNTDCEMFLSFFVDKVTDIRSILPSHTTEKAVKLMLHYCASLAQYHWKISQPLSPKRAPILALLILFQLFFLKMFFLH